MKFRRVGCSPSTSQIHFEQQRGHLRVPVKILLWAAICSWAAFASAQNQGLGLEQWRSGVSARLRATINSHAQYRQQFMADLLQVSVGSYDLLSKGAIPSLRQSFALASVYGVDLHWLLDLEGLRQNTSAVELRPDMKRGSIREIVQYAHTLQNLPIVSSDTPRPDDSNDLNELFLAVAIADDVKIEAAWREVVVRRAGARMDQAEPAMSLSQWEDELGQGKGTLARFFRGTRIITLGEGLSLAHVLGVSPDWLLNGEGLRQIRIRNSRMERLGSLIRWARDTAHPPSQIPSLEDLFNSDMSALRLAHPGAGQSNYLNLWKIAVGRQLKVLLMRARTASPGFNQRRLAREVKLSEPLLSQILSGADVLDLENAKRLGPILGLSVDQLLLGDELRSKYKSADAVNKFRAFREIVRHVLNCGVYLE